MCSVKPMGFSSRGPKYPLIMPIDVSPSMSKRARRRRIPPATAEASFTADGETDAEYETSSSAYPIRPVVHHSSSRAMNASSFVQSSASVQTREHFRPTLSRQAPVFSRPTKPGHWPEKLLASSNGLSLPTTPSVVWGP